MEMLFVYSLVDHGRIFYVGSSKNVYKRLQAHCSLDWGLEVQHYIQTLFAKGVFPEVRVLYYLPKEEALKKEAEIISLFSHCGHQLCNSDFNLRQLKIDRLEVKIKAKIPLQLKQLIEYTQQTLVYERLNRY